MLNLVTKGIKNIYLIKLAIRILVDLNKQNIGLVKLTYQTSRKGYENIIARQRDVESVVQILNDKLIKLKDDEYLGDIVIFGKEFTLLLCYQNHLHFKTREATLIPLIKDELDNLDYEYSIEEIEVEELSTAKLLELARLIKHSPAEEYEHLVEAVINEPNNLPVIEQYISTFKYKPEELLKTENLKLLEVLDQIGGMSTFKLFLKLGNASIKNRELTLRILYSVSYFTEFLNNEEYSDLRRQLMNFLDLVLNSWPEEDKDIYEQVATVISRWNKKISKSLLNDSRGLTRKMVEDSLIDLKSL